MYHINLCKEELEGEKAVILPGDPGRVPKIAALLQEAKPLAQNREYTSWLGRLEGQPVAVVSTGIGGPSAAIAVEELAQLGVETFVRVGTCGGMQLDVKAGDLVVVNACLLYTSHADDGQGHGARHLIDHAHGHRLDGRARQAAHVVAQDGPAGDGVNAHAQQRVDEREAVRPGLMRGLCHLHNRCV